MAHGTQGVPVDLNTFGGLVTLAKPESVPQGASPRCNDNDYLVGSTSTRAGLTNQISFSGSGVGPSAGGSAIDTVTGGIRWSNPANVLLNTGVYATANLAGSNSLASSTSTGSSQGGGVAWANPTNVDSGVSFATVSLSAGGTNYSPSVASGTVANAANAGNTSPADQITVLSGFASVSASAATLYVPISVAIADAMGGGSIQLQLSIDGGSSWPTTVGPWESNFSGTVPVPVSGITNLNTIQIRMVASCGCSPTGFCTVNGSISGWYATVAGGAGLTAQTLQAAISGLSVPAGATITGIGLSFQAEYSGVAPSFMVGLNVGNVDPSFTLTTSPATYTVGGSSSLWGYGSWSNATLSSLKVNFFASSAGTSGISVNSLVVTVYYTSTALGTDALDIETFGWSVPSSDTPQGFLLTIKGYASAAATLSAQMLKAGAPVGAPISVALNVGGVVTFTIGSSGNLFGSTWNYSDLNATNFGVRLTATSATGAFVSIGYVTLEAFLSPSQANFTWVTTFNAQNGVATNLYLDAGGNLYTSPVSANPQSLTIVETGIASNSSAVGVNGAGVEYIAFTDGKQGSDVPLQYTPNWIDRVTQVGPGAAPVFTPQVSTSSTFAISTITQPAANSDITDPGHISVLQWSAGPTSNAPGNVLTVFYSPSFYGGAPHPEAEDMVLTNAFNSGNAVYVYISGTPFGAGTYLVTSVGNALPPGVAHQRFYFTVQMPTVSYQQGIETAGQYQMSLATMTMSVPVPGLQVGNQVTISGSSVAGWDTAWPISQTINSGTMAITQTSVTASVATYSYTVVSGANPAAGQLVTITGTTNANGALNLANATISSVSGGSTGTFNIPVSVVTASSVPESGQATTAGTIFAFDPGVTTLGTMTSPILGNATGGTITFTAASAQLIGTGTRQGSVFFITRNNYYTCPGPPVTFDCPENTTAILASQVPLGPPNVVARGIIFTEAGQNGVPGANFFNIPSPVTYIVENVSYTASALIINDNTSTSASFQFTDFVLLNARAVDVYGYNLFNQIEIGNPGWIVNYDSRNFYGLCQNKIQNLINMSFDGGYLNPASPVPLGWSQPDIYGSLVVSPKFGNAYYVKNTSGGTLATAGLISQSAYQDYNGVAIISANTSYSVRVTARIPANNTEGNLLITLSAGGVVYGSYTLPFASMNSAFAIYTGTLLVNQFATVPANLILSVSVTGIANNADLEIDRIEVYDTSIPILGTTVYASYAGLVEQVDAVTGQGQFTSENQQPVNGALVMYDTFYGLKGQGPNASMYSWQASPNLEPAQWSEPEVAQRAGACGPLAFDFGEQWLVEACRNGIYLFEGGQPGKIMQEIYQIWDAINWAAGDTIWLGNDVTSRRLFVGVPLPTPNLWLPNAPVNAAPTSPNVILMCNYQGLDTAQEIKNSPQMHTTMFGTLNAIDMRRKWSIWQIPSPYAAIVQTATDKALYICNGKGNSKVYALDPTNQKDDGAPIASLYTTAGLPNDTKRAEMPMVGDGNVRVGYMNMTADITGLLNVRFLPNILLGPNDSVAGYNPWTVPGGFLGTGKSAWNRKSSVNFFCVRAFVEFSGPQFSISSLSLRIGKDSWSSGWGVK